MRINRELARNCPHLKENSRNGDLRTLSRQLSGALAITPTPAVTQGRTHAPGSFGIKRFSAERTVVIPAAHVHRPPVADKRLQCGPMGRLPQVPAPSAAHARLVRAVHLVRSAREYSVAGT